MPITTAAAAETKAILGAQLCATLVELTDPAWFPPFPAINTFQ